MAKLADIIQGKGLSLIPQLHLQQVDLFLWRKGIELYPAFDSDNTRAAFLQKLWKENKTSLYLTDIWEKGAISGSILLYVRPNGKSYRLNYYQKEEFKPYFNADGDLETVVINTTYQVESDRGGETTRYSKIRITTNSIEKWDSDRNISDSSVPDSVTPNPYETIPCVIIDNKPCGAGKRGKNEFAGLEGQIESHDWQVDQVHGNLEFFGGPIFYSSRSKQEMTEAGMIEERHSVAAAAGYGSTRSHERIKARRIFDNLEEGEQIGFASPEPINGENLEFINNFALKIRTALGSVDESEIRATKNGTSFEIRTILGRTIQTANRRAESYLTFGIAQAYSLMLQMAEHDGLLAKLGHDYDVHWRYLGDVFQESPSDLLTKSIVCRNLLRMGVNVKECLRFLFPDKRDGELETLLKEGFAYEFLNGIATVARTLATAKDPESGEYAIAIDTFIQEVLDGRPSDQSQEISHPGDSNSETSREDMASPDGVRHARRGNTKHSTNNRNSTSHTTDTPSSNSPNSTTTQLPQPTI